jgi:ABC-2 type transport system permease protein
VSLRNTVRSLPALLRVGFAEAVAYRAELLVWVLATTMPIIMLALWSAVARDAPIEGNGRRYGEAELTAYFLATFVVRQLTGSWAAWEMSMDVRQGTLSMRLLRPVHPLFTYAVENVAAMPMRLIVAIPVAVVLLLTVGRAQLTHDPVLWLMFFVSLLGGWLVTLFINLAIGCLALFIESSAKVMDVYLAAFFVMSGYIVPVGLFPASVRAAGDVLPFRYQLGLPVELMTRAYEGHRELALQMLGRQWLHVALGLLLTTLLWRRGLRRFEAYGG